MNIGEAGKRVLRQADWVKVREYIYGQKELREAGLEDTQQPPFAHTGDPYKEMVRLLNPEWSRSVNLCARSNRWWRKEWKELRKRSRKDKGARTELRRKIKKSKAKCWSERIEGQGHMGCIEGGEEPLQP